MDIKAIKYFLFKLPDYVSNTFHFIEKKRMESIDFFLITCISTYKEMNENSNDKIDRAFDSLVESLPYILENHPFSTIPLYRKDFIALRRQIQDNRNSKKILIQSIESLHKKLNSLPIIPSYIQSLKCAGSFKEIDVIICFLLSDLLYMGYSLKYIREWVSRNYQGSENFYADISRDDVEKYIDALSSFNFAYKEYKLYKKIAVVKIENIEYVSNYFGKYAVVVPNHDHPINWFNNDMNINAEFTINALDITKAISIANSKIESLVTNFRLFTGNKISVKADVIWVQLNGNEIITHDSRGDRSSYLVNFVDKRQKEMVDTFFDLNIVSDKENDIRIIERILHTFENAKHLNNQNR